MTPDELAAFRAACVSLLEGWRGLDAAGPMAPDYLDIIAHGERPQRRAEMAVMSSCGLVMRRYLDLVLAAAPARLRAPYVTGRAIEDLADVAREAGAALPPGALPEGGDVVIVRAPEHAFGVVSCTLLPDGNAELQSVEGGERDGAGHEQIGPRGRLWTPRDGGWTDVALDPECVRQVVAVWSLEALAARFGAAGVASFAPAG